MQSYRDHPKLEEEEVLLDVNHQGSRNTRWLLISAILIISHVTTSLLTYLLAKTTNWCDVNLVGGRDPHTPWMSGVDRSLQDYRFMPFNLTPGRCSASALEAGDDVDDAWKDLGVYYNVAILPEEYAPAYGVSRSQHHHLTPDTDPDVPYAGFPVNIQVFHQLHCLNMLRQGLYHNADFYRKDPSNIAWSGDQDEVLQAHLAHCVDDLRQLIMCFADNDVVPYLKPEGNIQPMPEFSRWKKCRNFESLRQWGEKNHWQAGFNATPIHKHTP